jgi:hypothetical protein
MYRCFTYKILITFNVYKRLLPDHKLFSNKFNFPYFVATKNLITIKHTAYELFLMLYKSLPLQPSPLSLHILDITASIKNSIHTINNALICDALCKTQLIEHAKTFQFFNQFHFYTDSAVKSLGTTDCLSGYGWIQTSPSSPKLIFKGSTLFSPSSTKSEVMAILIAIIILPIGSTCTIFIDSANCINTFYDKLNNPQKSPRQKLKQKHFLIWNLIF